MTDQPYDIVTYDGKKMDRLTLAAIEAAEDDLGYDLTIVQGCYQALDGTANDVKASGGTHDGGGVVDLLPFDHQRKVRALRRVGFAAWFRPELWRNGVLIWREHIHAVLIGNAKLSPAAAAQVKDYYKGLNGLADHAPDPTWRPDPIPVFKWVSPTLRVFPVRHRIAFANMYVNNTGMVAGLVRLAAKVKAAFGFGPDVIALNETHRMLDKLDDVGGYDVHADREHGEAGRELAVLVRSGLKVLGTRFHPAAAGTGTGVFAHPRGIYVVKYVKRGRRVAVVNTHLGVIGHENELELAAGKQPGLAAQQHAEHVALVVKIVQRLRGNGWTVFVTSDANSRGRWPRSLPSQLEAAGMRVTRTGVDLIASDPTRVKAPDVEIVSKAVTGSDAHDAIAIRTTERKRQ